MMKFSVITVAFLISFSALSIKAERIVNLDFEPPANLNPHSTSGDYRAYWLLRDSGFGSPFDFIVDTPHNDPDGRPKIIEGIGINDSHGLDIFVGPTVVLPDADRDRFEMRPIHGGGDLALRFGQVRYFGYAIYINPLNDFPIEWAHISQVWQRPVGSLEDVNVNAVPMWMTLLQYEGGFGWEIRVKNEGQANSEGFYTGQSSSVGMGSFQPGWNTVIMRLEPNHKHSNQEANFTVWINENREDFPTAQSSFPWGSTPDSDPPPGDLPLTGKDDAFDVRCGIYRRKQPVSLHLVFDNIRYGTTFESVVPTCLPNPFDINNDCVVDLLDFAILADQWLKCTDPENENCLEYIQLVNN